MKNTQSRAPVYNGILVFDKPADCSSHGVVARLRRLTGQRRIGHGGTLDPMATGVLPVLFGIATKASDLILASDKEYTVSLRLGVATDTQDVTGTVLKQAAPASEEALLAVLPRFCGKLRQVPPMYSALSKGGTRLYTLARQGIEVEREPRTVEIRSLRFLGGGDGEYTLAIACTKGTYIRTLVSDIGGALGCGAVMTALRRTRTGMFSIEDAADFEKAEAAAGDGAFGALLLPVDRVFAGYPALVLSEEGARRAENGAWVPPGEADAPLPPEGLCRVYDGAGRFIMLGRRGFSPHGEAALVPHKMFISEER